MKIAVIILNWNGKDLLKQFLPSVIKFSDEATIYVADNNSSDDSIAFVKRHFTEVKIIKNDSNGGYAKGYNDALQQVEEDIYCLLNSDIEVTENWLTPIKKAFKTQNVAAVQPKILDYKDKSKFEYAGAAGGFIDKYGYPFCRGRVFSNVEVDSGQYNDNIDIFWASGACLFIRKNIFRTLGGFDEDYFAHQEEIDLCWRIFNSGHLIKYIGTSTVYHVGGATLGALNPRKTFLNFRNSLFNLLKNGPKDKRFSLIFIRMCLDGIAGFKYLLELKPLHFFAILKAHFSFYTSCNKMLKKSKTGQRQDNYFKTKSIVWDYYVKKKYTIK